MRLFKFKREISIFLLIGLIIGCTTPEKPSYEIYTGPDTVTKNINAVFTDSAKVTAKVKAPVQEIFQNEDQCFPKGVNAQFYDKDEQVESTLVCDSAYKVFKTQIWTLSGNVEIINVQKKEKLNTEELYLNLPEDRIWTDKFVMIESETQTLTGTGLESNQNFSEYEILNPIGTFDIED